MTIQDELRLPPRDGLPSGVTIPHLPVLGTTWYERGASYWLRRAGLSLMFAVVLVAWTFLIGAFVKASGPVGSPAFTGVLVAEIVFSLGSGSWVFWRMRNRSSGGWMPSVRTVTIATRVGSVIIILLWGVIALLSYGLFLALFLRSLVPVLPTERVARSLLADELQKGHHRIAPPTRTGGHPGSKRHSRRGNR